MNRLSFFYEVCYNADHNKVAKETIYEHSDR